MVNIRTAYGLRERHPFVTVGSSMTEQSAKAECDINNILRKYMKTRLISHVNANQGQYGDFLGVQDYHACIEQVKAAQDMFDSLPSNIRKRFANDPSQFLAFVTDDANREEAIGLGLIPKPVVSDVSTGDVKPVDK